MDMSYKIAISCFAIALGLLCYMIIFDQEPMEKCLKVYSTDTCVLELR